MPRASHTIVGALLFAPAAPADILLTKDGRIVDGPRMERVEGHLVVHFENGEVRVPEAMVQDAFLAAELDDLPRSRRRQLEEQLERRRAEIEDARAHSVWGNAYANETDHFEWKYTIPRHIALGLQQRFEAYFEYFEKEWKLKFDRRQKLPINFYRERKQFQRVANASGGTLAYFRFVPPYDLNAYYDRTDPVETEMVLYHELSHYVQKLVDQDFDMPHFPSESVAEYYGASVWNEERRELEVGLVQEGRLTEVQQDVLLGKHVSIRDIVTKDAYTDYTWGWALVHFLMSDKKRAAAFERYFLGLARDRGVERVRGSFNLMTVEGDESLRYFMLCLGLKSDRDMAVFEDEFHRYLREELVHQTPSGLEKAAIGAKRVGQELRAKRLFGEAEAAGGLTAIGCHHYAELLEKEEPDRARDLWKRATELDPLSATFLEAYARSLKSKVDSERLLKLARELDPESAG